MEKDNLNNQSFNDTELSNGYHLLTESSHTVKVNTPSVPLETAHLYPRLAGSNWTCYLSQATVILGRTNTNTSEDGKKNFVHVDFGGSKAISRKHCEIRFSAKRDRWELYVYGRNGVKLNHVLRKPRDKPVVLTTGVLIEISNTSFVFILPNNYLKPTDDSTQTPSQKTNTDTDSEVNTPVSEDLSVDHDVERAIMALLVKHTSLYTFEIYDELKSSYDKSIEKDNVLYTLVLSPKFRLTSSSVSMSAKESDLVKWMLKDPTAAAKEVEATQVPASLRIARAPSSSLSKFWKEDDNQWSIFEPFTRMNMDADDWDEEEDELDEDDDDDRPPPPVVPPPLFQGMSIESIYSIWNSVAALKLDSVPGDDKPAEEPPNKRVRQNSDASGKIKKDSQKLQEANSKDIFKQVRTTIVL